MKISESLLTKVSKFRQQLHSFPELSGAEKNTAKAVSHFISDTSPSEAINNIGGYGFAAIYDSGNPGPVVLLRADLDALPIQESNTFSHRSTVDGVAHLCGHDGHMAILTGIAHIIKESKAVKGKVVLLFQPAEETGQGANLVINDKKYKKIVPDYAFALHNLPGFEKGVICLKTGSFASASTGMIVKLKGLSSHAAHPEDGNNPDKTMAELIIKMNEINELKNNFKDFSLITVIHAKLGEQAFGTTPGNAVLMATLRTYLNDDMKILKEMTEDLVDKICAANKIKYDISYTEEFPATVNNDDCISMIQNAAEKASVKTQQLNSPFRWSEDFGHFTQTGKAALFGIGSGTNHPQLHNEDYDFPDELIEPAMKVFKGILEELGIIEGA